VRSTPDSDPESGADSANAPPRPAPPHRYTSQPLRRSDLVGLRVLAGFFGYLLLTLVWFATGAKREVPLVKAAGRWGMATAGLLGVALYLNRRHGRAGYGYGILLALVLATLLVGGIVLLVRGLCSGL
jgi:hypothetical protein